MEPAEQRRALAAFLASFNKRVLESATLSAGHAADGAAPSAPAT